METHLIPEGVSPISRPEAERRYVVLSDDSFVGQDAAHSIGDIDPGASVVFCRTLDDAVDAVAAPRPLTALFMLSPRKPLAGNPLLPLLRARDAALVVLTSNRTFEIPEGEDVVLDEMPFSAQSIRALVSKVRTGRPQG
ncbi:hypothetical protein [Roseivivax isoporae]|uniref:hypothetical protein n=1 Tax=Roseivivax isoporae TaxID=591206 RepID=UPI0012EB6D9F|nr:hypothetical protein [Roseivivax isoporae]